MALITVKLLPPMVSSKTIHTWGFFIHFQPLFLRPILIEGHNKNKSDPNLTKRLICFCFVMFVILRPLWKRTRTRYMFTFINDETIMIRIFYKILVLNRLPQPRRACVIIILLDTKSHHPCTSNNKVQWTTKNKDLLVAQQFTRNCKASQPS